jgi:hypothetical protein
VFPHSQSAPPVISKAESFTKERSDHDTAAPPTTTKTGTLQGQPTQQQGAMRVDQRAWLGIADARFTIDAKQLKVDFTAKNVGKSPAITVFSNVAWVGKLKGQKLQPRDIVYPLKDMKNGTIFQEQVFNLENRLPEPVSAYQAVYVDLLSKGDSVLYAFAKVEYKDVFKASHWTHYCVIVGKDLKSNSPCDMYNDSDSDTQEQKAHPHESAQSPTPN